MTLEHLTNEELAGYLSSTMSGRVVFAIPVKIGDEGVEFKRYAYTHLAHEAARRLRNSIPKPMVELYECDSSWYVRINGSDVLADNPLNYYKAQLWFEAVKQALGLEGDPR